MISYIYKYCCFYKWLIGYVDFIVSETSDENTEGRKYDVCGHINIIQENYGGDACIIN